MLFAACAALMTAAGCKKKDAEAEVPAAETPAPAPETPAAPPDEPAAPAAPPPALPKERETATVPDLKGKTVVEAVGIATEAGLLIRLGESREVKGATPGTIVTQTPAAGQTVERLTVVVLTPADAPAPPPAPPAQIDVPSVKGQTVQQARLELFEKGFTPKVGKPQFTGGAPGKVVEQTPAAKAKAAKGSVVTIVPEKAVILVPDLRKQPVVDGILRLRRLDLDWNGKEQASRDVPPGTVLDQDPKPGSNVDHDKAVTLTVAKAPGGDARAPKYASDLDDVRKLGRADLDEVTRLLGKVLPKNYVSAIDLDPNSPVQRRVGESVNVSFSYATEFGKDTLIYVIPRSKGKEIPGIRGLQFRAESDGQGTFQGSITAQSWFQTSLHVDEIHVVMYRFGGGHWGDKMLETRTPVRIHFDNR
ncbi:MAG TPA: PASTA domain-containing protein [Planctomycetota bacterium]